jgi:ABC-type glycerol-3-phosphate transport system permease component
MLRGFFMQIPSELDDAARLDGANRLQALYRVVLPLSAPGLIAVAIFALINSWNNYLYSFAFTSSAEVQVVPARLLGFITAFGTNYGGMNAAGLVAIVPPLLFFLIFQKWFVQGMLQGSVK